MVTGIIFYRQDRSNVLDLTLAADNAVLQEVHEHKVQYYDVPDIRNWVVHNISSNEVKFLSMSLSWRGLMACASADTLCSDLALGRQVLNLLSAVTCEKSLWI